MRLPTERRRSALPFNSQKRRPQANSFSPNAKKSSQPCISAFALARLSDVHKMPVVPQENSPRILPSFCA